jgi:DMSO/TMAO reductase YedYZ molybdopterin-dependent catalytic subunit
MAELKALGGQKAKWTAHGQTHEVEGVPLDLVLTHFGFEAGPMGPDVPKALKRAGWKKAVIASAADGFQAVFSCAELMPSMGGTRVLIAWSVDGKDLPADDGPLRLVVLTDQEPSRSIYALRTLEVVDLRERPRCRP